MTHHTVEYCEVVRAAHDTATKLLNRGQTAARYHVHVDTTGGQTASVNWRDTAVTMCLPSFKPDTRMTRAEADRIVGYIAHECCHVLHTQWKTWEQAVADGPAIARLTNGIEDVRIEAAEIATGYLPNLRNVLSETLNAKHWQAIQERKAQGLPPCGAIAQDMSYVLCVLGRLANGYSVPCAMGLRASLPAKFKPIVDYALKRMPRLANTRDALKLAREIAARLAALPKPAQPQPGQQTAKQPTPGKPGEAQDAPGQPGEAGEAQDAPGQPGEAQDGKPGGNGAGEGGQPDLDAPPIEPDSDLASLVQGAKDRTGDAATSADLSPLNTFAGATRHPLPGHSIGRSYGDRLRAMAPHPAKLRNQVAQIVRSQERHGHERFRSVGRMDRRALARIAVGASNVYARRTFVPGVDTAVVILIDGSGSMSSCMGLAHLMALHLAEAIEHARGKCAITGFWGGGDIVTLAVVKGFTDKFDPSRLANFGVQQSTPLSCAILSAADLLREVHADRKIILTLTDGGCDFGPDCVRASVAMVGKRGVECAGIGIGVDVSYAFTINATVTDPHQLATEGLATLVRAIEARRAAR